MSNNGKRQISVSCDRDTETALIRIFKFRNYSFKGGKVFEVKKNSPFFKMIEKLISRCGNTGLAFEEGFKLWKDENIQAITYNLEIIKEKEIAQENKDVDKTENINIIPPKKGKKKHVK